MAPSIALLRKAKCLSIACFFLNVWPDVATLFPLKCCLKFYLFDFINQVRNRKVIFSHYILDRKNLNINSKYLKVLAFSNFSLY